MVVNQAQGEQGLCDLASRVPITGRSLTVLCNTAVLFAEAYLASMSLLETSDRLVVSQGFTGLRFLRIVQ